MPRAAARRYGPRKPAWPKQAVKAQAASVAVMLWATEREGCNVLEFARKLQALPSVQGVNDILFMTCSDIGRSRVSSIPICMQSQVLSICQAWYISAVMGFSAIPGTYLKLIWNLCVSLLIEINYLKKKEDCKAVLKLLSLLKSHWCCALPFKFIF